MKGVGTRGKGGAALVTAIAFVFFLMLFGLAFYRLGETDIDLFGHDKNLSKALYASEAGIEKVRWMLKESHRIPGANPFSSTYVEANAIAIANPTSGNFFPGETDEPYFRVSMIQDASKLDPNEKSKVRVRVLGSVDLDADGEGGLTGSEGVFSFDPDDVNRKFEAYIGLPGTLGERIGGKGISAGAGAFYDSSTGVEVPLSSGSRPFVTPDGDTLNGFLYSGSATFGNWDQWGFIFSDPVKSGEIELPRGIFDEVGDYIDDDNNGIPDYFQDLNLRTYTGNQIFTPDPGNDPTAGAEGRRVIYVNGDITIRRVDFGYLSDETGDIKNCDWEKAKTDRTFADLAFIANGKITVDRVDCGNVGRLVLVAKDIELVGGYNTKVNGIAIASNDIILNGQYCDDGILTHQTDFSRPVKYTAYFLGSMVAKNHIKLQSDGWTVIYDENVINGKMYSTTVSKPTLTYERAEAEDFNSSNNWELTPSPLQSAYTQGRYTEDERATAQGDYGDEGLDELPELMRVYIDRNTWLPRYAIGETLRLDFTTGDFEDPDILDSSRQNWDYYDAITFWMALDNFKRTSNDGTRTTSRRAEYIIRFRDAWGTTISVPLETLYPESEWGTVRYHHVGDEYMNEIRDLTAGEKASGETYSRWKRVKITLKNPDDSDFDFTRVERFDIRYSNLTVSWTAEVGKPNAFVTWFSTHFEYVDENGVNLPIEGKDTQGDLNSDPPAPNDGYNYLYYYNETTGLYTWFRWFEDPNSPIDLRMREEVLMPTLRIDRLELPGKPASNDYLQYGLPHCLRLEVTNWQEL